MRNSGDGSLQVAIELSERLLGIDVGEVDVELVEVADELGKEPLHLSGGLGDVADELLAVSDELGVTHSSDARLVL